MGSNGLPVLSSENRIMEIDRLPNGLRQKIRKFSVHIVWQNPDTVAPLIEQSLQKRTL